MSNITIAGGNNNGEPVINIQADGKCDGGISMKDATLEYGANELIDEVAPVWTKGAKSFEPIKCPDLTISVGDECYYVGTPVIKDTWTDQSPR